MNRLLRTLATIFVVILVSGCGQTGPLYVPGNPSEIKAPPNSGQNAEQKTEDEQGEDSTEESVTE